MLLLLETAIRMKLSQNSLSLTKPEDYAIVLFIYLFIYPSIHLLVRRLTQKPCSD